MSDQRFLMRFDGGPEDGNTRAVPGPWPLPEEVGMWPDTSGKYRKVSESQLTEDHPGLIRGAQYRWEPGEFGDSVRNSP